MLLPRVFGGTLWQKRTDLLFPCKTILLKKKIKFVSDDYWSIGIYWNLLERYHLVPCIDGIIIQLPGTWYLVPYHTVYFISFEWNNRCFYFCVKIVFYSLFYVRTGTVPYLQLIYWNWSCKYPQKSSLIELIVRMNCTYVGALYFEFGIEVNVWYIFFYFLFNGFQCNLAGTVRYHTVQN